MVINAEHVQLRKEREDYWRAVLGAYLHPYSFRQEKLIEGFERNQAEAEKTRIEARWEEDRKVFTGHLASRLGWIPSDAPGRLSALDRALLQGAVEALNAGNPVLRLEAGKPFDAAGLLRDLHVGVDESGCLADVRQGALRFMLARLIEDGLVPRFYEFDYLEDIVAIVRSRYSALESYHGERSAAVLKALAILGGQPGADTAEIPAALARCLGPDHGFVPRRGPPLGYMRTIIPDLADEFLALRGRDNPERFLHCTREYSLRQRNGTGVYDVRELCFLRGYERDTHLLLRTLVKLVLEKRISREDEILIIGSRYSDEIHFMRNLLGLPRTVGLDLFDSPDGMVMSGDMHAMPFADGRFKAIFCAGTLTYSYDVRKVVSEMMRVLRRPGFVFLMDGADRVAGPDPLGRTDLAGLDGVLNLFYAHPRKVLARDTGKSDGTYYRHYPCVALEFTGEGAGFPANPPLR